jgi:hypothetical protein
MHPADRRLKLLSAFSHDGANANAISPEIKSRITAAFRFASRHNLVVKKCYPGTIPPIGLLISASAFI